MQVIIWAAQLIYLESSQWTFKPIVKWKKNQNNPKCPKKENSYVLIVFVAFDLSKKETAIRSLTSCSLFNDLYSREYLHTHMWPPKNNLEYLSAAISVGSNQFNFRKKIAFQKSLNYFRLLPWLMENVFESPTSISSCGFGRDFWSDRSWKS